MNHEHDPLAPVCEALVGRARERADELRRRARQDAAAVLAEARRQAEVIVSEARAEGRAQGRIAGEAERTRARREAREIVLAARRAAYAELYGRVRAAVGDLRDDACYPRLIERLTEMARQNVPEGAVVEPPGGGVEAVGPGVRVDLSLEALADLAVDRLGAEVTDLWNPG
ncbi:MAG: V-type ATP synthase subunit E family protein [Actinomadura sp.]